MTMTQADQAIQRHHHITLCVGTAQQDYDFHTQVLSLKSVKKTLIYDGGTPFYHLYYGNDTGEESTLTAGVRPRRLSHVLLFSADINRSIDFYRDALGLRLSDRSHDAVAFMHARHGSDHHLVAFAGSSAKGWHHSSWDVDGIDEVGKGGEQMRKAGYAEGWGTGRHVLGSNFFHYVRDPWGSFAEYSADIDFIPTGMPWPAGDYPPEDSLYLWGPEVPAYFIHNSEA
jgi:catechol 2,3-dioxygenase-like lactoylglutathione lyase family enzyme